jgi:hypothetical protein
MIKEGFGVMFPEDAVNEVEGAPPLLETKGVVFLRLASHSKTTYLHIRSG